MTITLRRALAVALTFAVAVFVAACGGSSSNKTSETTPAATEASTTATTAGPAKKVTLLMNAGRIVVILGTGEDEVRVDVVDEGIGIDLHELPLVFEKFYAGADPTHHSSGRYQFKARGPGLGLAIAKGYVEAHGGRIWAESKGSGRGSAFHVVLPRRAPLTASASAA